MNKYSCLCCGYKTLEEKPPGTFEICPICYWEDDLSDGGANNLTLREAKENFKRYGVSDVKYKNSVRKPLTSDERNPQWESLYWPTESKLYSKQKFAENLLLLANQNASTKQVSDWAHNLYLTSNREFEEGLSEVVMKLIAMDEGPEFEYTKEELIKLANDLLKYSNFIKLSSLLNKSLSLLAGYQNGNIDLTRDIADMHILVNANEAGVALEQLISVILEEKIEISEDLYRLIEQAGTMMKMDSSIWQKISK